MGRECGGRLARVDFEVQQVVAVSRNFGCAQSGVDFKTTVANLRHRTSKRPARREHEWISVAQEAPTTMKLGFVGHSCFYFPQDY